MITFWLFCFQEQLLSKVANVPFEELKEFCNNFVSHFFKPGGLDLSQLCLDLSRSCLDCVSIVSRSCLNCVSIVSRLCLDRVSIVSQSCLNRALIVSWSRVSISTLAKSKSHQSRKSRHFQNFCLNSRDILTGFKSWSRQIKKFQSQLLRPPGCHFLFSFYSIEKLLST